MIGNSYPHIPQKNKMLKHAFEVMTLSEGSNVWFYMSIKWTG